MFTDTAKISIKSGRGGDGCVSFRRELYVPNGGPDGGDGGKGGDLILEVDKGMDTLSNFRHKKTYIAPDGQAGGSRCRHGKNGDDLILKVPYGTVVRVPESGQVITDMSGDNLREVLLKGGKGGLGNMHFSTPSMQAPRYAQAGRDGLRLDVLLELKVIADVGLVGFPNVGKSTLISLSSNARPQVANYHFTTLRPHLGVVELGDKSFVMADIPGLVEGASQGAGLGDEFLRHVQRCRVLVHVVDAAGTEGRDPIEDIKKINQELKNFDPNLLKLPCIIAANKIDCFLGFDAAEAEIQKIKDRFETMDCPVIPISCATGEGIKNLLYKALDLVEHASLTTLIYNKDYDIYAHQKKDESLYISKESDGVFCVSGDKVEKMLGYTNLNTERGFNFFQNFMKDQAIIDKLKKLGLRNGDTVKVSSMEFEYYE